MNKREKAIILNKISESVKRLHIDADCELDYHFSLGYKNALISIAYKLGIKHEDIVNAENNAQFVRDEELVE